MTDANLHVMDLPPAFVRLNEADPEWLLGLPTQIAQLECRWSLQVGHHVPEIEYNFVAPATRFGLGRDPEACVLKLNRRVREAANEIAALRLWDGRGAARVIEADLEIGALLIERVLPGTMLVEVAEADDDAATLITAGILRQLWATAVTPGDIAGLRSLDSWCAAYDRNREALSRGAEGIPAALFLRADALRRELLDSAPEPTPLHGDMHHYNILRNQHGEWLAIDPKGLVGDPCFDVCQFMRNPRDRTSPALNRRRLDIFCAELGLDRRRAKDWCLVHTVLDACWELEGPAASEGNAEFSHEPNHPAPISPRRRERLRRAVARAEATLSY